MLHYPRRRCRSACGERARSGTENVHKIHAESFVGAEHLAAVQAEAREVVGMALSS